MKDIKLKTAFLQTDIFIDIYSVTHYFSLNIYILLIEIRLFPEKFVAVIHLRSLFLLPDTVRFSFTFHYKQKAMPMF